jgi:hypothetical protein
MVYPWWGLTFNEMNFGYWLLGIIIKKNCTKKAMKRATFKLLHGTIDDMGLNIKLWRWDGKEELMKYNVKLVKNLIKSKKNFNCDVP